MQQKNTAEAESGVKAILELIGEDPSSKRLEKTPKKFIEYITSALSGYQKDPVEVIQKSSGVFCGDLGSEGNSENIIALRKIHFSSYCEDHFIPFDGTINIGYIPNQKIGTFGSIVRAIDAASKRLQTQERLCLEICRAIHVGLGARGAIVQSRAFHTCLSKINHSAQSSEVCIMHRNGIFASGNTSEELTNSFFHLLNGAT